MRVRWCSITNLAGSAAGITGREHALPFCTPSSGRLAVPPEILEPVRSQLGVSNRMLDIAMAQPSLQSPSVMPCVRQGEAARMSQHVRVDCKRHAGAFPNAL